jgi:hypothetical protein
MVYFRHMGGKETTVKELGEMLTHVVDHMATKDDIVDLRKTMATKDDIGNLAGQLTSAEHELKSIRRDLDDLREKVGNVIGFQKEIDHALERIAAIEKHLGINQEDRRLTVTIAYVVTDIAGLTCTCNICSKGRQLGGHSFCLRYSASISYAQKLLIVFSPIRPYQYSRHFGT